MAARVARDPLWQGQRSSFDAWFAASEPPPCDERRFKAGHARVVPRFLKPARCAGPLCRLEVDPCAGPLRPVSSLDLELRLRPPRTQPTTDLLRLRLWSCGQGASIFRAKRAVPPWPE